MLEITIINDNVALAPQIPTEAIAALAEHGYTQIICNRPDNEDPNQPTIKSIQNEADKHQISVIHAPVINGGFTMESVVKTHDALSNNKKTLMYCRSGMRSSVLWAISQVRSGVSLDEVFSQLRDVGYDIGYLHEFIEASAGN